MKPTKKYARKLTTCACGRPGVKIVDRTSVCDRCLSMPQAETYVRDNYRKS